VDVASLLASLEQTGLATRIRDSLFLFPLIESVHVIGLALVFGTIAIVDLRLLGVASTERSFQRLASDVMKWTWAAFALTALTGLLMFTTNATGYFNNFYFRAKISLLVLAAINVLAFEWTVARTVHVWNEARSAPPAGRAVAVVSLAIWLAVVVAGRMIGFTSTRVQPAPADINFDELFHGPNEKK
jgi:hypothetical protein